MIPFHIGNILVDPPLVLAPMAGVTNRAFRLMCKRAGGCGLVTTEMFSAYAIKFRDPGTKGMLDWTDEERPVSVQIFGGDPARMAEAARVVEAIGADAVDVNMGCPVPKIARNEAGCRLMRDPARATAIVAATDREKRFMDASMVLIFRQKAGAVNCEAARGATPGASPRLPAGARTRS